MRLYKNTEAKRPFGQRLQFEVLEPRYVLDSTVVFNEAMYHPLGNESAQEWVEVFNQLSVPIDMSGWRLAGGIDFSFPEGTVLAGGQYLVVASSPNDLQSLTGISNVVGPFSGSLGNSGELIELRDRNDRIMDAMDYRDSGDWPVAPDGSGVSLAKRDPYLPSESADDWTFSTVLGGTPGVDNRSEQFITTTPIEMESSWKYHDLGVDLGTAWRTPQFNDSAWAAGAGLFFDNSGPTSVPQQTALNPGSNTYYFRTTFEFQGDPADVAELSINALVDDGAVFYLNGVEVHRLNMPTGSIEFSTSALSEVGDASATGPISISAANLVSGTNVLAVEVHQYEPGIANPLAYYRFEEASGTAIIDTVSGAVHGQLIDATRTADVPASTIPQSGAPNLSSANLVDSRAVIEAQPFLFHDPSVGGVVGNATLEWYMKFPVADDHSAIFWSNTGPSDADRFNIFWNAGFTGVANSDRSISGDFHTSASGHSDIGNHANGVPLTLGEWHHVAIVRIDNTPNNSSDADFTWQWYIDGQLSPNHTSTTTDSLPTSNNGWLIAGRQGGDSSGADVLIDEIRLTQGALSSSQFLNTTNNGSNEADVLFGAELRVSEHAPPTSLVLNEIAAGGSGFQVELVNHGDTTIDLAGYILSQSRGTTTTDFLLPAQMLAPGQFATFNTDQLGFVPQVGDKLFLYAPGHSLVSDAMDVDARLRGRITTGVGDWFFPSLPTFGSANQFELQDAIVINEIMYHHQVIIAADETAQDSPEEWIELYNRGTVAVDLSGWSFANAIDYVFPPGTTLGPGEYLIVSNDADELRMKFAGITIIGNLDRNLSNGSDPIVLLDEHGNPADEVHYYDEKPWPEHSDGGGSSLELRDPFADNSKPEAWAASDESQAAEWQTYTYRGIAGPGDTGSPQYHELVVGLLGAGEILLDNISVLEDPDGLRRELIQNGTFEVGHDAKWRIIGNHHDQVIDDPDDPSNKALHLVATGRTDDMHNHAETTLKSGNTFVSIVPGREYEISFRAKWLGGSNLLNTRLYFYQLQETTRLETPQVNGTPGSENSRRETNIGPTFSDLQHGPVVPSAGQPVVVSVAVEDSHGVASVLLRWRRDGQIWSNTPMILGSNGRYVATIPGQTAGTRVQFFVRATDNLGAVSEYPAEGEESRALYVVEDDRAQLGTLHNIRIVMTSSDLALFDAGTNLMSNDLLGATVIVNESDVYYDVGVRRSGAASSRQGVHGFRVQFNADQLYLGLHETITVDRNHNEEIFVRHLINHAGGIPGMYNDLVYFIGPTGDRTGLAQVRMAGFDDIYLESQYPNGDDGLVFEKELTYRQRLSNPADVESLKVPFGYTHPPELNTDIANLGSDTELYRWHWLIKNQRDIDDYSGIVALNQAYSLGGAELEAATSEIIDVDQWMRALAAIRLLGNRDFYSQPQSTGATESWKHNFWVYQRPSDGKFIFMPWDIDENFQVAFNDPAIFGTDNVASVIQLPNNLHYYWGHLDDLITTTFNAAYMAPWGSQFSGLLGGRNFAADESYIVNRANFIRSQMPSMAPFRIETSQVPSVVNAASVAVEGEGWVNVREIRLSGRPGSLNVIWTSPTTWTADVPLSLGVNQLQFEAYDFQGNLIETPFDNAVVVRSTLLAGDYNDDGSVDSLDHTLWNDTFGSATDLRADGNHDGVVDAADYTIWRDNLGATLPPDTEAFSFDFLGQTYTQDINSFRGTEETLPEFFTITVAAGTDIYRGVFNSTTSAASSFTGIMGSTSDDVDYSIAWRESTGSANLDDARLLFTFTNNTGEAITGFQFSYDVEAWVNGRRDNQVRFKYDVYPDSIASQAAEGRNAFETDVAATINPNHTPIASNGEQFVLDGKNSANRVTVSGLVDLTTLLLDETNPGLGVFGTLLPGQTAYFRWQISNANLTEGNRSALAVDNLSLTAVASGAAQAVAALEPAAVAGGNTYFGAWLDVQQERGFLTAVTQASRDAVFRSTSRNDLLLTVVGRESRLAGSSVHNRENQQPGIDATDSRQEAASKTRPLASAIDASCTDRLNALDVALAQFGDIDQRMY